MKLSHAHSHVYFFGGGAQTPDASRLTPSCNTGTLPCAANEGLSQLSFTTSHFPHSVIGPKYLVTVRASLTGKAPLLVWHAAIQGRKRLHCTRKY